MRQQQTFGPKEFAKKRLVAPKRSSQQTSKSSSLFINQFFASRELHLLQSECSFFRFSFESKEKRFCLLFLLVALDMRFVICDLCGLSTNVSQKLHLSPGVKQAEIVSFFARQNANASPNHSKTQSMQSNSNFLASISARLNFLLLFAAVLLRQVTATQRQSFLQKKVSRKATETFLRKVCCATKRKAAIEEEKTKKRKLLRN